MITFKTHKIFFCLIFFFFMKNPGNFWFLLESPINFFKSVIHSTEKHLRTQVNFDNERRFGLSNTFKKEFPKIASYLQRI